MDRRILVVYDSRTGNTEKLAQAVANGARRVSGVEVVLKRAREVLQMMCPQRTLMLSVLLPTSV